MSLLQATFASDTESDDEEFQDTTKPDSSEEEEEAADHPEDSSSSSTRRTGDAAAAAEGAAADAAGAEVVARGGRKRWSLDIKANKRKEKRRQREQQRAAADAVYAELQQQHNESIKKYPASVAADDLLLRFHKRVVSVKAPTTSASVLEALRVHCSKVQPSSVEAAAAAAAATAAAAERGASPFPASDPPAVGDAAAAAATAAPTAGGPTTAAAATPVTAAVAMAVAEYQPAEKLDAAALKKRCRLASSESLKNIIRDALQEGAAQSEKIITKTVRFAGREFQIEERVSADKFAALEKAQHKKVKVRGDLQALEALDRALGTATAVNSVQKSRADWMKFKEKTGLDDELRRGRGYLERQAFLANTTWNIHQQNVELRRQHEQQKQMQQQLQQQKPAGL